MIKSVTVTNYLGENLVLELANPYTTGLAVEHISGIGPGEANINMTEIATNDGSLYNSARIPSREIEIGLIFLWNPTIEDSRHLTYKYFPIKKEVILTFETDQRLLRTRGYVQRNEPDIFKKQEGCTISIVCEDPYFYSVKNTDDETISFYGITPLFEFPFSNEPYEEVEGDYIWTPDIEFGNINSYSEKLFVYKGEVEVGITIVMHAIGAASDITIFNVQTREQMRIDSSKLIALTGHDIMAGDTITIITIKGRKSIYLRRDGVDINILNCLDKDTDWFTLTIGDNVFAFTAESGRENIQFTLSFQNAYEGV